jgi:Flp pilus assembly protein TadG
MRAVMRRERLGRGQALVEMAIAAPLLLLLVVGVAQVGVIVYDQVTIDTAAREGARVGSEQPNSSQAYSSGTATSPPYATCPASGSSTNPVCNAVWNASGLLTGHSMSVTIAPQQPGANPATCSSSPTAVADGYVQVTVSYQAPVFVPLLGQLFQTGPGVRQVTSVVTARVEPCTLTQGQ